MAEALYLSIVIPAYNEVRRLPNTLTRISNYCQEQFPAKHEIIVVDDGSSDDTLKFLQQQQAALPGLRIVSYTKNRGKGYAIKKGIENAEGKYVVFSDADLSTPIEEIEKILARLEEGCPVVIGTRKHPGSEVLKHQPVWRESMGKVYTWISNRTLGLKVSDFTCGFKGFERAHARQIFDAQTIDRWAFDSEILFLASYYNFPLSEVPVRWANSPETKVHIVKDTITSFAALLQIRWNQLVGKYKAK